MCRQARTAGAQPVHPRLSLQLPAGSACLGWAQSGPRAMLILWMKIQQVRAAAATIPCLSSKQLLAGKGLRPPDKPLWKSHTAPHADALQPTVVMCPPCGNHVSHHTGAVLCVQRALSCASWKPSLLHTPSHSMGRSWPSCAATSSSRAR
jgi:hypothetical protein